MRVTYFLLLLLLLASALGVYARLESPRMNLKSTPDQSMDGYWLMRAPIMSENYLSGLSQARRYGPNLGNGRDVGVLWKPTTKDDEGKYLTNEERHCGAWTQFYFDEAVTSLNDLQSVYCRAWTYLEATDLPVGEVLGISVEENYNSYFYLDSIPYESALVGQSINNYNLVVYSNDNLNYQISDSQDLWGASFKITGGFPQVLSYPDQRSFCIVNYDSSQIHLQDSDNDGLTDYEEMFETYTDPYAEDTDKDNFKDYSEIVAGTNPLEPYDWLDKYTYLPGEANGKIYLSVKEGMQEKPQIESERSTLQRELTPEEYAVINEFDRNSLEIAYESNPWSSVQVNARFKIEQAPEDIEIINIVFGGKWVSYDNLGDESYKIIEIVNQNDGENAVFPGKIGHTSALYLQKISSNINDYIDSQGYLYLRAYTINRYSNSALGLDYMQLEVLSHKPTDECPDCELNMR